MMTFVNTKSEGLLILPGHRVAAHVHDFSWSGVRRHLEPWFAAEEFPFSGSGERAAAKRKFLAKLTRSRQTRAIRVSPPPSPGTHPSYLCALRADVTLPHHLPPH